MIAKQHVFGIAAIAFVTGMIVGGQIATVQAEVRCTENMAKILLQNNLAWFDPQTGEFKILKVQPFQPLNTEEN